MNRRGVSSMKKLCKCNHPHWLHSHRDKGYRDDGCRAINVKDNQWCSCTQWRPRTERKKHGNLKAV